jgi:hypothetical protein
VSWGTSGKYAFVALQLRPRCLYSTDEQFSIPSIFSLSPCDFLISVQQYTARESEDNHTFRMLQNRKIYDVDFLSLSLSQFLPTIPTIFREPPTLAPPSTQIYISHNTVYSPAMSSARSASPSSSECEPEDEDVVIMKYRGVRVREQRAEAAERKLRALERDYESGSELIQRGAEFDSVARAYRGVSRKFEKAKIALKESRAALKTSETEKAALKDKNAQLEEDMEGERARATAEADQLRGELGTLKANETTSIKRSSDEMLEHHGLLALRPAGHKRMRRAGVRNARSVS